MRRAKQSKSKNKFVSHKSDEVLTEEKRNILLKECFDTESNDFKKMWEIIQRSLDNPSKNSCIEKHHIIPRSYFKKMKQDYINEGNLVSLPAYDHYRVHYYAYKCATPLMKNSMTLAFNFMAKKCMKIWDENDLNFSSKMYEQFREEHRKSISKSLKDYYSDEKTRDEISKRVEEKWKDPEYKKRLKEVNKQYWVQRHQKMFPDENYNELFRLELKFIAEGFGKINNRVAREIYGDGRDLFTIDQQKILGIENYIRTERHIEPPLYFCDEIGFIGSLEDLAYIFNVSDYVIKDAIKCNKKINNLTITKEDHPVIARFMHECIKDFLYPLWKKQGEHLFDTLRDIFNKMEKYSND